MKDRRTGWIVAAAMLALASPGFAQPDPAQTMQALPDPGYDAARGVFEALPQADRAAIQDALVWTGDYAAAADGSFGRRTFEAIQSWQRRARQPVTGVLDRAAVAALMTTATRAKAATGFAVMADAASGARIGIPQKLLPKRSPNQIGGTRYQSADGRVTLDTRSQPGGAEDLRGLYERNLSIQTAGRSITYRLARPDFFVIAGETAGGRFYSRYAHEGGAIRGFSIGYDKALAAEFDRLTIAIANSFQPFGAAAPQPGLMAETPTPPARPPLIPVAPTRGSSLTGLSVAPRRVLTAAAALPSCPEPRIDGAPARIVSTGKGVAVLEPAGSRQTVPLRFAGAEPGGTGTVAFYAANEGGRAVVTPAEFVPGGRLVAPLQDGAAGAVVLDGTGAVAGIVGSVAAGRRSVAGLVPPAAYPFVTAATLQEAAGASAPAGTGEAGARSPAAAIIPALVRIDCAERAVRP